MKYPGSVKDSPEAFPIERFGKSGLFGRLWLGYQGLIFSI
jgi:hypothetical protein